MKKISVLLICLLFISVISATQLTTRYNPWTGKLDYVSNGNFSGGNLTANWGFLNLNWSWIQNFPEPNLNVNSSDYWDNLNSTSDINAGDITDDGTYRLNSWDNFTGIPTATPSNGDTTHLSTADQIYDWVISLAYATVVYVDGFTHLSNFTDNLGNRGYTSNLNFTNDANYINDSTLTDNSMADTLHRHSELSASDGTPDQALVVDATGNVGIGTASPLVWGGSSKTLTIEGGAADAGGFLVLRAPSVSSGSAEIGRITWYAGADSLGGISLVNKGGTTSSQMDFQTQNAGSLGTRMSIDASGNVGIGMASPTSPLYVVGNAYFTADVSALTFTDRTPFYDGDALSEIKLIKGIDGEIDHDTLPDFVKSYKNTTIYETQNVTEDIFNEETNKTEKVKKEKEVPIGTEETIERNLGNMISVLVKGVQELFDWNTEQDDRIKLLEDENQELKTRLDIIESQLNITYILTEQVEMYHCNNTNLTIDCPGGLSGGIGTRCYRETDLYWFQAAYCSIGWDSVIIEVSKDKIIGG